MVERGRGTLADLSPVAGRETFAHHTAYAGTKFVVHAMSENLREEVAPYGVRATVIAPGAVETEPLSHTSSKEIKAGYEEWKKTNASPAPETVAEAVRYAHAQPKEVRIRELVPAGSRQQARGQRRLGPGGENIGRLLLPWHRTLGGTVEQQG